MRSFCRSLFGTVIVTAGALTLTSCSSTNLSEPSFNEAQPTPTVEVTETQYVTEEAPEAPQTEAENTPESTTAAKGDVCITYSDGRELVALEDGTTCDIAIDVMDQYADADDVQGSAGFWTSPQGWGCFSRYVIDGKEDLPENRRVSCSDSDAAGNPASEGSGAVAALKPGERDLL